MAITITDTPQPFTPAYNENMFVASSTNSALPNFRYKCELQDPLTLLTFATVEVFPDSNNLMLFDARRIVENYVTSNPTLSNMTELSTCPQSYKYYRLKVTERYGSVLADGASGVTSGLYAFNAALKWKDFTGYDPADYFIKHPVSSFLTNSPSEQSICENENAFLHFGVLENLTAKYARVKTYDNLGNLAQTVLIENNYWNVNINDAGKFMRMPAGWNLNAITPLASGTQPIIHSSISRWVIDVVESDGTTVLITGAKTFVNQCGCSPYTSYRLHFLNSLGGFDSFTFNRREERNHKIQRDSFEPVYGSVTSGVWSYSKTEQRKKAFFIEENETLKLNSDWISEAQSAWLYELVTSPEIYVESGGDIYSASMKTSEYNTRNHASDKIFNLEIELELGKNYRQRW